MMNTKKIQIASNVEDNLRKFFHIIQEMILRLLIKQQWIGYHTKLIQEMEVHSILLILVFLTTLGRELLLKLMF
jgi:hypothetical protein